MNNSAPNLNLSKVQNSTGPQQRQQLHHHHHQQQQQQHHHHHQHNHNPQLPTSTTPSLVVDLNSSSNISSSSSSSCCNSASNTTDPHIINNNTSSVSNPANTGISTGIVTSTTSSDHVSSSSPSISNLRRISANHPQQQQTTVAATTPVTNNNTNGSLSDSFASTDGGHRSHNVKLSKTNLYIKGLQPNTSDRDLYNMCSRFGQISSTKAILEKVTGFCRGYGFVEFTSSQSAELAVQELTKSGIQAQMAKISPLYSSHHHQQPHHHHHHHNHHHQHNNNNNTITNHNSQLQHNQNSSNTNDADPTNLYIANLPPNMSEQELENLLSIYGPVVSTRILRDQSNIPRGVGFARMESRDKCEQIIEHLNGRPCKGGKEPLLVKFADGKKKAHHHNNQHLHQHQNNNQNQQHHKAHQDDSRWRESSNTSDLGSASSFDHQGNISHSNHLSDLAMMSTLGYPRMQPGYPPAVATGTAYPPPPPLGPPTSAPQWIHPGGPGQPYVIPQQMIQAGGLGPSNQAAAAAALHYGHIPQLTSQMQGLQIAHPGAPVGGYLPPHQWSALWTHPIQQQTQPSMRIPASMHPLPPPQQQSSPQSTPVQQQPPPQQQPLQQQQQQPPIQHQHTPVTDNKLQVSVPL